MNITVNAINRFWAKVDKRGPNECWPWLAATGVGGYGRFELHGRVIYAHRLAYELCVGPIPDGLQVLHNCPNGDNPACCNPAHLWLGTDIDNHADKASKGRAASGEHNGQHILTESEVKLARAQYTGKRGEQARLARHFHMSYSAMRSILRYKTWRHIK